MKEYSSPARKAFVVFNFIFLTLASLTCILPFIHLLALSFSSSSAVAAGRVGFWPIEPTLSAYEVCAARRQIRNSAVGECQARFAGREREPGVDGADGIPAVKAARKACVPQYIHGILRCHDDTEWRLDTDVCTGRATGPAQQPVGADTARCAAGL